MNSNVDEILFVTFNQDATSLAVGSKRGYQLYNLNQVDELAKLHESDDKLFPAVDDVYIVERLFSSSLVTLVSLSAPRKLQVCHFQKKQEICNQSYPNSILAVRLNRLRLVVCLEESLYIHNIRDMKVLHTIKDTPPNPQGICELCSSDISYLAYPGSVQNGEVQIFDASNLQAVTMITAHSSPLAALKFNGDGTKLATASEKGTVIKVFSVPGGEKLFEFRRGMKRCVTIYSLAFSADSMFLCCSSNTETIHVFKLEHHHNVKETKPAPEEVAGVHGWLNIVSKTAASYLPTQVSDIFQQDRAFAPAKLPHAGSRNVCALTTLKQKPRLLVASMEGYLFVYDFNKDEGGECVLIKQHRLLSSSNVVVCQESTSTSPHSTNVTATTPTSTPVGSSASSGGKPPSTTETQKQKQQNIQINDNSSSAASARSYAAAISQAEEDKITRTTTASKTTTATISADKNNTPSSSAARVNESHLKLDDIHEFPPMTHLSG